MNLDKLNQWLTLLANVGVLAGIFFLAIEMQQNTEMMRAQTRDAVTEKLTNWFMDVGANPEAAQVMSNGNRLADLDIEAGEPLMYTLMVQGNLRLWENELYQYEKGLFEEEEFHARKLAWELLMRSPGYQRVWEGGKTMYSPRFQIEIDSLLNLSTK